MAFPAGVEIWQRQTTKDRIWCYKALGGRDGRAITEGLEKDEHSTILVDGGGTSECLLNPWNGWVWEWALCKAMDSDDYGLKEAPRVVSGQKMRSEGGGKWGGLAAVWILWISRDFVNSARFFPVLGMLGLFVGQEYLRKYSFFSRSSLPGGIDLSPPQYGADTLL